jgi:hypothetical protein
MKEIPDLSSPKKALLHILVDVLHPYCTLKVVWDFMCLGIMAGLALFLPVYISFSTTSSLRSTTNATMLIVDAFFALDIFMNFRYELQSACHVMASGCTCIIDSKIITFQDSIPQWRASGWHTGVEAECHCKELCTTVVFC